jgi:hypothetical protein
MAALVRLLVLLLAALTLGEAGLAVAGNGGAGPRRTEVVPARVGEVDVRSSRGISRRVTNPAEVTTIVRWFDALHVDRSRGMYACPMIRANSPTVRFAFRDTNGNVLARASVLDAFHGLSGPCNPIDFRIRGHRELPLIGGHFLRRVQRLLGVRFG